MRRANGTGNIYKIKGGKRRKPWRVRVTVGWELNPKTGRCKQNLKTLGYYASRAEAEAALVAYQECPYDLNTKDITFKELYEQWTEDYFKKLTSISSERTITSAYRYCSGLYNMKMRDIRIYHLQECMDKGYIIPDRGKEKGQKRYASACTKGRIKSMFNLMFDWAYAREIVDRNYARAFELDKETKIKQVREKRKNTIFSKEEIDLLWKNVDKIAFVDMVLCGIYSGWRPQELAILKIKDIDLELQVMYGGMKTDAGKDRCVPIHPLIQPLIEKRYAEAKELGSNYLFNDINGQQGIYMTYDKYRGRFNKVVERLQMDHHPHETRHTFITKAKRVRMEEYILKRIVGHAINDNTEKTYTHREIEELKAEMRKIED
ncbi:tyrosine-type recombinase/integrase [Faecalimonas umbilicata]|uniref:tyrosine-type recombinase/integrase n=1 Tax=Faecalimonas umbilicata TaxID=1912855 RepID=UPI0022E21891|nr:site-specific integrase [Faecalimonas umbilicata]